MSRSSRRDLLIFAGIICFSIVLYFYSDAVLVMYTERNTGYLLIGLGIACYLYMVYLADRYLRENRRKLLTSMAASFGPAFLLWVLVGFNFIKIPLLIGYLQGTPAHTMLPLLDVSQRKYKGSFNGGRVKTVLERDTVMLDCSRTLYFALKDRTRVPADYGLSADGRNWFISKVYLDDRDYSAARSAYRRYWRHERLPLLLLLAVLLSGAAVLYKLDDAGMIRMRVTQESRTTYEKPGSKRALPLFLLVFGLTLTGLLLWILFITHSRR